MAVKPGNGGNGERDPRLDLLYRDAAREGPPANLDAAILAAARREVGARPRSLSTQLRRWRVPASIAAVVVLSVSLVTLVGEKSTDPLMIELRSTAKLPVARTEEPPEQPAEPAKAPEVRQRARTATPEAFSLRLDEGPAKATAAPKSAAEGDTRSSTEPAAGPETAATPPALGIRGMLQDSPPRAAADAPQQQAPTIGIRGSAADAAPPAAAPQPMPMEKRIQAERAKPLAGKRPPVWHGLEQEPPQKWLERLADLRKQGRTGEANELLAELKRRFPDHPLPSGLE